MYSELKQQIERLSVDERIELITEVWDGLPEESIESPAWHLQEIERRLQMDPAATLPASSEAANCSHGCQPVGVINAQT